MIARIRGTVAEVRATSVYLDLGDLTYEVFVPAVSLPELHTRIGQRVTLRLEAHPDTEYSGQVRTIGRLVEPPTPTHPLYFPRKEGGFPDVFLRPDPETLRPVPWLGGEGWSATSASGSALSGSCSSTAGTSLASRKNPLCSSPRCR